MTNKFSINTILFDLDGTLIDSALDLSYAFNELLLQHNLTPMPLEELRKEVAIGLTHIIVDKFSTNNKSKRYKTIRKQFSSIYLSQITQHTRLFPGIEQLLDHVINKGYSWGIVTNKPKLFTQPIINHFPQLQQAQTIVCGDTLPHSKPHPHPITYACEQLSAIPAQTLMVGDTKVDMDTAQRAGTKAIAVDYNIPIPQHLAKEWGAIKLCSHPSELIQWLIDNGQPNNA